MGISPPPNQSLPNFLPHYLPCPTGIVEHLSKFYSMVLCESCAKMEQYTREPPVELASLVYIQAHQASWMNLIYISPNTEQYSRVLRRVGTAGKVFTQSRSRFCEYRTGFSISCTGAKYSIVLVRHRVVRCDGGLRPLP